MIDFHVHTDISYCAEKGLKPEFYAGTLSSLEEPDSVCVTDHAMAIYFPEELAWKWGFMSDSSIFDQYQDYGNERMRSYIKTVKSLKKKRVHLGIETEMMHDGRLTFDPSFTSEFDIVIGSVHFLPVSSDTDILNLWLTHSLDLINSGIDILGHPFRWITQKMTLDENIIKTVVKESRDCNVALELNSHYQYPELDITMLRICADIGAKASIASDAHRKEEFADYSYHKNIIEKSGVDFEKLVLKI